MAVSARKVIYDIVKKINAVNSGRATNYRVVDLVSFANDAYEVVVEHLMLEKDQNESVRNHLRYLMVPNAQFECKKTEDCDVCKIEYPSDFFEIINIRMTTCKSCCKGTKEFPVPKPQGDDIDEARKNPYRRANFYFEQGLCYESTDGLRFFHENEYDILHVNMDYYRKIKRIETPTLVECADHVYKNWDESIVLTDVDFEIDTYLNRKVSDVAAYMIGVASKDYPFSQAELQKIISINQVYK